MSIQVFDLYLLEISWKYLMEEGEHHCLQGWLKSGYKIMTDKLQTDQESFIFQVSFFGATLTEITGLSGVI